MLMPPEAEPVMPASRLTAMAREISGLSPPTEVTQRLIASKAASEAITEPKPTRLAVLKIGNSEALAPLSRVVVSASRRLRQQRQRQGGQVPLRRRQGHLGAARILHQLAEDQIGRA